MSERVGVTAATLLREQARVWRWVPDEEAAMDARDRIAAALPALADALEALESIAKRDELVEANDAAFAIHAYRRCVASAEAALAVVTAQLQGS